MKIRFSLYENVGQEHALMALEDTWGDDFDRNREVILKSIVKALLPLELQLSTVLERERMGGEIGFDVWMKEYERTEDVLCVQSYLAPEVGGLQSLEKLEKVFWFKIGKSFAVFFAVIDDLSQKEDETILVEVIEQYAYEKVKIISSDVAREGISKEMKQEIGEMKRVLSHLDTLIVFRQAF